MRGTGNVERSAAYVVDGFIVNHESTVGMLQSGVSGKNGVVGLDNRCGVLRSRVDGEFQLGLFAEIDRKTFE